MCDIFSQPVLIKNNQQGNRKTKLRSRVFESYSSLIFDENEEIGPMFYKDREMHQA